MKEKTGDDSLSATLITLKELENLGCTGINDDYSISYDETCENSEHRSWLVDNREDFWRTRSHDYDGTSVFVVSGDGYITTYPPEDSAEVFPVITISKETYDRYYNN